MPKKEAYYRADLLSVDAWREEGGWTWNASYIIERGIIMAESAITTRRVLNLLRMVDCLSEYSKGRVIVSDQWPIIEIQLKSNRMPLYALMFDERPCGHK